MNKPRTKAKQRRKARDAEAQWSFWPKRRPVPAASAAAGVAPSDAREEGESHSPDQVEVASLFAALRGKSPGILAIHGIGAGTGKEREGFSEKLCREVFPDSGERNARWKECVWEDLNDELDAKVARIVRTMAHGPLLEGLVTQSRRAKRLLRMVGLSGKDDHYLKMLDNLTQDMISGFFTKILDFGMDYCLYLDPGHGARVRKRLREKIEGAAADSADGIMLLAHSLGSVIAYDVLAQARARGERLPVLGMITFGSPLAWTFELREADERPEREFRGIGDIPWANLYYREDFVPLYRPLPADRFPEAHNFVLPFPRHATPRTIHKAYWRDAVVARIVREAAQRIMPHKDTRHE